MLSDAPVCTLYSWQSAIGARISRGSPDWSSDGYGPHQERLRMTADVIVR